MVRLGGTPRVPPGASVNPSLVGVHQIEAPDFDEPNNADWAVAAPAFLAVDPVNAAMSERLFDDTVEEGVGFSLFIPTEATTLTLTYCYRAITNPSAAVLASPKLYYRLNGGIWGNLALPDLTLSDAAWVQGVSQEVDLPATGINLTPNNFYQFEWTRDPTSLTDSLVGDLALGAIAYLVL